MNQMYLLLLGILGIAAVGTLLSGSDDEEFDQGDDIPELPAIDGTDEAERIDGTDASELIRGLDGNDTIDGGGGDDWIYAGRGEDVVEADPGNDRIFLGSGNDRYGGYDIGTDEGNDTIEGGSGHDTITVNSGRHVIWGDDSDDEFEGHDSITAYGGQVTIHGGGGNDTIAAHDGRAGGPDLSDELYGGDGNDLIEVGAGDLADGGEGQDTYRLTHGFDPATLIYEPRDRIVVTFEGSADNPPAYEVVQSGADSHLVVGGSVLAVLKDIEADRVGGISFEAVTPPRGGGYVVPVTDPVPVVVVDSSVTGAAAGAVADGGPALGGIAGPITGR